MDFNRNNLRIIEREAGWNQLPAPTQTTLDGGGSCTKAILLLLTDSSQKHEKP